MAFKPLHIQNAKTFKIDNTKNLPATIPSQNNNQEIIQNNEPNNESILNQLFRPTFKPESLKISAYQPGYGNYYGGSTFSGGKWPYGLSASGRGVLINHYTTRQNARGAYQENPQAKALVDRYADSVADTGLIVESTPKADILGISSEKAQEWAQKVEEAFDLWARSKLSHRSENMSFYQSHRLYQIFQQRDNDIFTRLYYSKRKDLLNPLQFEFVDTDQIRGDAFTSSWGYKSNYDGITKDEQGRDKSYKIWYQIPGKTNYEEADIPRKGKKSNRLFMLHGFSPEYAGQQRGYSRLGHAIQEFENITDFTSSTIKKAINSSGLIMYVKPGPDKPASNPLEGITGTMGAGPIIEQYGANAVPPSTAQNVPNEIISPVEYYALPEATFNVPGSTGVFNLKEGEDLKDFKSSVASESFDSFISAFTSFLAASMSMPIEVLLMKFSNNYSASRATLLLFWRVVMIWREEMATDYLNPVFEMWLSEEIAAGRIFAPGWQDPRLKMAWLSCRWIGSPMPNIDPLRSSKADKTYVELAAQSLNAVSRNLNGSSFKSNKERLRTEYENFPIAPWLKEKNKG